MLRSAPIFPITAVCAGLLPAAARAAPAAGVRASYADHSAVASLYAS